MVIDMPYCPILFLSKPPILVEEERPWIS